MSKMASLFLAANLVALPATLTFAARGSDGAVNVFAWQAPSMLNPYLASSGKDSMAASLVLEPLAGYDEDGKLFARLAADIPTVQNGGISKDLKSITWKLKSGLKWSDGSSVTAEDVMFTANYCMEPGGGCAALSRFQDIEKVEALGDLQVKLTFKQPMMNPYGPFVGVTSPIIQAKQFAGCLGVKAPTCTDANFNPVGTGPFIVISFKPNDAIQMKANPNYRDPNKPAFADLNYKGGGDSLGAARAVLQTGEFDYTFYVQLAPDVLKKMEEAGKGKVLVGFGTLVEMLEFNLTDPSSGLPAEERATAKHPNRVLGDLRVRKALSMALDRATLTKIGYGFMGKPTCDWIPAPKAFAAGDMSCLKQDISGAKKLLDEAGWKPGADGIREKDGKKLRLVFQTTTNAVRQQFQALIKQWWQEIGAEVELKNVNGSVFFGSDPNSSDTQQKFYADVQMYGDYFIGNDPGTAVARFKCENAPRPANQWQGSNTVRYCDKEYDRLVDELGQTAEEAKRGEIVKRLNTLLTSASYTRIPIIWRGSVSAISNTLGGHVFNTWDTEFWNAQDWFRKK
ncbi:peptide ABC transporter substrate-binding protein [Bradyrhizobium yuanmingense]|uniref:peptide ABC transporter substrate-binding protein n=1 Tax=Bradyrhizobium yuanmingense TaxID=108015 RepID=UPI0023B9F1EF|nr:peptide ABC transporter substrate-binding protein [Bradyrhizobium yuanmingense]MDF0498951.1 peptide ABC transporter substrate-binding protein [Bradyrhizobium yuanmingense]